MRSYLNREADISEFALIGETTHPENLVVAMHGLTSNYECIRKTLLPLTERFPRTLFLLPNAPISLKMTAKDIEETREKYADFEPEKARSWYDIRRPGWLRLAFHGMRNSLPVGCELHGLTNAARETYNIPANKTLFIAISQSSFPAVVAASRMADEGEPPAGVCLLAGVLPITGPRVKEAFDLLMVTGAEDERTMKNKSIIDGYFQSHANAVMHLRKSGVQVTEIIIPNLGHLVDEQMIEKASAFIARKFYPLFPALNTTPVLQAA